jgi:hypothetical protein
MSFNLPTGEETKAVSFGFGRSAADVRRYVSQCAEKSGRRDNPVTDLVVTKHCKSSQSIFINALTIYEWLEIANIYAVLWHESAYSGTLSLSIALQPFRPWPFFQFLNRITVARTPWTGDQPVARPLPTQRTVQTRNKRTQTSMPRAGFEHTTSVFERAKAVHASDHVATVIGSYSGTIILKSRLLWNYQYRTTIGMTHVHTMPITVAARSKTWTVFPRSNTGIVGSNPTRGMNNCVRLFCVCVVLCVDGGLETGWSPVQGVLPTA